MLSPWSREASVGMLFTKAIHCEKSLEYARHRGWCNPHGNRLNYLRHNGPEHILAFAPTRSGKGVGLVIPTLLAWSESAVVYDIKGENWAKTAGFRQAQGHVCFKFFPVEVGNGSRFNPLSEVRIGTPRDVLDAQNVADMIVRTGEDSPQERYWQDAAASITTGMILHVCYAAAAEGTIDDLVNHARPISLYLVVPPSDKIRCVPSSG